MVRRRGGLLSLIGQGVGFASEYNAHRREQNESRNAYQPEYQQEQGPVELPTEPMDRPREQQQPHPATPSASPAAYVSNLPPAYAESASGTEVSLGAGRQLSPNEKGAIPQEDLSDPELTDDDDNSLLSVGDEGDWELDDLEELDGVASRPDNGNLPTYEQSEAMSQHETVDDLVRQVVETSRNQIQAEEVHDPVPGPSSEQARARLPCPVILPQRRPRKKQRGFVRAYAPVLKDVGISQDTFMTFLKSLHKSSQASPVFPAIQVSAAIAGFAPSVIAMAVTTVVQVGAAAGAELQTRSRTNNFLDRMNDELFKPAGLYAMIVKYKSDTEIDQSGSGAAGLLSSLIRAEKVDLTTNQVVAKYSRAEPSGSANRSLAERLQSLRLASDSTEGSANMPTAAALIYPDLDKVVARDGPESFKDKTKDAQRFLADYLDRKAQMQYAVQNPDSSLATPQSQRAFKSSLGDPSHPMHSGSLSALITGGRLDLRHDFRERKRERRLDKDVRRFERGKKPKEGKRVRRFGDDYVDDLHARIQERITGHRERLHSLGRGGPGSLIRTISEQSSGHESIKSNGEASSSKISKLGSTRDEVDLRNRRSRRRATGRPLGMVKRVMREDVLYLMIVNLPSDAELAAAREELGMIQQQD